MFARDNAKGAQAILPIQASGEAVSGNDRYSEWRSLSHTFEFATAEISGKIRICSACGRLNSNADGQTETGEAPVAEEHHSDGQPCCVLDSISIASAG